MFSLLTEREGAAIVLSQHLQQSGEVLGISWRETPRPVEHIRGVSCQGRHHKRHEVRILVIIPVIGDALRPLPKGTGYILRMSFLASEFRDLNLIREPILPSYASLLRRGYHLSRYYYSDFYFLFGHVSSWTSCPGWRYRERFLPHLRLGEKRGILDVPGFR